MKRNPVMLSAFLLFAAMLLSLAACGDVPPVEEEGSVTIPVNSEPLTYHVYEEIEALAREIVPANSKFPTKAEELPWGTVLDRITEYDYDLNGHAQSRVTYYSPDEFDDDPIEIDIENSRPERRVITAESSGDVLCEYLFTFDTERRLIAEERIAYADLSSGRMFEAPEKDIYGFDEEGHLINWKHDNDFEISYHYSEGKLIKTATDSPKGHETMEITRDAEGRVISTVVNRANGATATYSFGYDKTGRVISGETVDGRTRTVLELSYDADGWPKTMKVYVNGSRMRTERYSFEKKSEELTVGKAKVEYDEANIFGGSSYSFAYPENQTDRGEYNDSAVYELTVIGTKIRYVKSSARYEFKMIPVRSEVNEKDFASLNTLEEFYPVLTESYGGYRVPQPDGTQQLRKIVIHSNLGELIDIVSTIVYDQKERPAGQVCALDLEALRALEKAELDDNGRPFRTENGGLIAQYSYADDMRSYKVVGEIPEYAYHRENEITIEERMPEKLLTLNDKEIFNNPNYHLEYSNDGLLTKYSYLNIFEHEYVYYYEADAGKLSSVRFTEEGIGDPQLFMCFDDHGYLTQFTRIMEHEIITFTYSYIDAE